MSEKQEKMENVKFEEAIEIAGYGKYSMLIIFMSGLAACSSFIGSIDISFVITAAECDLQLTSYRKGTLGSAFFLGVMFTCHPAGFLADTLGRRYVLLRSLWFNVIIYICGTFAPNFWFFTFCKFISGIFLGPSLVAYSPFIGEYVPASRRSQALILSYFLASLALFHTTLMAWLILDQVWQLDLWFVQFTPWRLYYLLCSLPSVLAAVLFYLTPESPKFLLSRGKKGDTIKVLQRVHSINSGKLPQSFPVGSVILDDNEKIAPSRQKGPLGLLKNICDQTLLVFKPPYLKNLTLCIVASFVTNLCANGLLLWLPEVTNRIATNKGSHDGDVYFCELMMYYSHNMTQDTTHGCDDSIIHSSVFFTNLVLAIAQESYTLSIFFIVPLVDKRAVSMLVMIVTGLLMILITKVPDSNLMTILYVAMPVVTSAVFNVVTNILVEIFPTYIRAMAMSVVLLLSRLASIVGSHMFSHLIDSHCSLLFYSIAGMLICCSVAPICINLKSTKSVSEKEQLE